MVCIIKHILIQVGPVAPLEDDKTSPEMSNLIEQEVKRFTKVLFEYMSGNLLHFVSSCAFITEIVQFRISCACVCWLIRML